MSSKIPNSPDVLGMSPRGQAAIRSIVALLARQAAREFVDQHFSAKNGRAPAVPEDEQPEP